MLELAPLPTECEAICFEAGERNWKIQPLQYTFPTLHFFVHLNILKEPFQDLQA